MAVDVREKLVELQFKADIEDETSENATQHREYIADLMIAHGVTVQEWISVKDHNPKEPGEYTVAQKHWCDGHFESKKGKWNGVEWFVDGRESLMVAYWMPQLPLPHPPIGE